MNAQEYTARHYANGGCDMCTTCPGCGTRLCFELGGNVLDDIRDPFTGEDYADLYCSTPCITKEKTA